MKKTIPQTPRPIPRRAVVATMGLHHPIHRPHLLLPDPLRNDYGHRAEDGRVRTLLQASIHPLLNPKGSHLIILFTVLLY